MKSFIIFLFVFCVGILVFRDEVLAQNRQGTLVVSPAFVDVTLHEPGDTERIQLNYTNNSSQPVTLQMFPLDFQYTDADGSIGFMQQEGTYSYSLASFLSLESSEITINAHESRTFRVVVENRPDLTPGGHYAAVIGKIISGAPEGLGATVSPSVSTLIFLRKTGGERYNLSLREVEKPGIMRMTYPKTIQLEFQNEGNIHLVPYGTVEIKDSFGRLIKRGVLNTSSFLVMPESRRNITVDLQRVGKSFPLSVNTLTVTGNDSLKKTTFLYRDTYLYMHPAILIVLFIITFGGIVWKKRKKLESTKYDHNIKNKSNNQPKKPRSKSKKR